MARAIVVIVVETACQYTTMLISPKIDTHFNPKLAELAKDRNKMPSLDLKWTEGWHFNGDYHPTLAKYLSTNSVQLVQHIYI